MPMRKFKIQAAACCSLLLGFSAMSQTAPHESPDPQEHQESAAHPAALLEQNSTTQAPHQHGAQPEAQAQNRHDAIAPALPEGMTLDETLDRANQPPPEYWPDAIMDNELYTMTLVEQLEHRLAGNGNDQIGWDAQGWVGYDYDKFWWKFEGETALEGSSQGESETDLLYARLITPFWYAQVGIQYANGWESGDYSDTWSAVLALQGLAPGMFEVDASLYLSEDADLSFVVEASYDLRLTQRLVLQPRVEMTFLAQDNPSEGLGAGLATTDLDLRLRYEIEREFSPYIGIRYRFHSGETADLMNAAGEDTEQIFLLVGLRLVF